ncbi:MAG TPA: CSLREA domain-containing protein, partial [Chthoniobacterales bacterium]
MFGLMVMAVTAARANTFTVTTTADHAVNACDGECTLRDAIAAAGSNDTIVFGATITGTIALASGELTVNKNLTIAGPGARVLTVSGNSASRILYVTSGVTVAISGLSFANGYLANTTSGPTVLGGAAVFNQGTLSLTACAFTSNAVKLVDVNNGSFSVAARADGGAISNDFFAVIRLRDCMVSFNSVEASTALGAGLFNQGHAVLINTTFSSNTLKPGGSSRTASGGGIYTRYNKSSLVAANCTIYGNTYAESIGGADYVACGGICVEAGAPVILQNTIVAGNTAPSASPDVGGEFTSRGHNLIGDTSGSTGWISTDQTGKSVASLHLTGLINNGGPTNTHAPQPGSIAIDMGAAELAMDPGPDRI